MPDEKDPYRTQRIPSAQGSSRERTSSRSREPDREPSRTRSSRSQQRRRQNSVIRYIAVLFIAAFMLLLITFMMERRQNLQQIDDLKQSVSAFQTLQGMMDENSRLKTEADQLQDQITALQSQLTAAQQEQDQLRAQIQAKEKVSQAMDWFWQIDEAYVRGKYTLCRSLISSLEEAGLQELLPKESITDNGRFSPADRFAEIRGRVVK